jgi:HEAT repeat protein
MVHRPRVTRRSDLRTKLAGGDRRSIGRVPEIVALVIEQPQRLDDLVEALGDPDPLVRMRAADALEKTTVGRPAWLFGHKRMLLGLTETATQIELRWHLAQLLPRLDLTPSERRRAVTAMTHYLDDHSSIVKTFAMQALAELAGADRQLRSRIIPLLRKCTREGTPAMRSAAASCSMLSRRPAISETVDQQRLDRVAQHLSIGSL